MRPVILVFAKAPIPGRVKTRLHTDLTPEQAARLHKAFVFDTLESLNQLSARADIELHSDVPTDEWPLSYRLQAAGDLGERMLFACAEALAAGRPRVMIVGADSPTLPVAHLQRLFAAEQDVALGPTEDGGYYAIACRRVDPAMFAGVAWSTAETLAQTVAACHRAGLTTALGEPWWDVDSGEDLARLRQEKSLPPHTRAIMEHVARLKTGAKAPDFTLETDNGESVKLSSYKGKTVVLFFYPKADTPGCTTEACEFRDAETALAHAGAVVLGISPDVAAKQAKFKTKFSLPYTLLADHEHKVAEAFGVWVEKSMYGKKYLGVERTPFVIGADGKIARVFEKVKPAGHAAEVLAALQSLGIPR